MISRRYPISATRSVAHKWPSQTVHGRSNAAATMALGAGSRNDGIANTRVAASHSRRSTTKVAVGASWSGSTMRRRLAAPASGGGTGEELSTDMVRQGVEGGIGQGFERARARHRHHDFL